MITKFKNYQELSTFAADKIVQLVKFKPAAVLCLAGGDTPALTYDMVVEMATAESVSFAAVTLIGLDEWVGIERTMPGSCYHFLQHKIFDPLQISQHQIHFFNPMAHDLQKECNRINTSVQNAGGIDLALVGIGLNGHIGFNEPGVDSSLNAHVVELDKVTTTTGQKYFTTSTPLALGITLGIAQLLSAGEVLLMASGTKKANIVRQALQEPVSNVVPASLIASHPATLVLLDEEAAAEL